MARSGTRREADQKVRANIEELVGRHGASLESVEQILRKHGIDEDVENFLEKRMSSLIRIEPKKVMPKLFNPSGPRDLSGWGG